MQFLIDSYNSDNYDAIWNQCDAQVHAVISKEKFISEYKVLKA